MFQTFAINQYNGRPQIIDQEGQLAEAAVEGLPIRVDRRHPYKNALTNQATSVPVEVLGKQAFLSIPRIQTMITGPNKICIPGFKSLLSGPTEEFRETIGFTDPIYGPKNPTLALWLEFRDGFPRMYKFLLGGPSLGIMFNMNHFFGVDGKGVTPRRQFKCSVL